MRTFELARMSKRDVYLLMIDAIVPRPIAWVSTRSKSGVVNLAPFSFFCGVSSDPPTLAISIGSKRDGSKKDTLINIEETGEFVVNSASQGLLTQMHQTSAEYDYGINEMERVGLTELVSVHVAPPRVKEASIQMECKHLKTVEIGKTALVLGTILTVHVADAVLRGDRIDALALDPVARLGGHLYGKTRELIELGPAQAHGLTRRETQGG